MQLVTPREEIALDSAEAPEPARAPQTVNSKLPTSTYWQRLREPAHLVERDLALIERVPRLTHVVDVGCGNGGFVRACLDRGIDAIGVEAYAESVAVAERAGIRVIQAPGEDLPFASDSLDVVRLKEVLEHVQDPLALAAEMRRVLRPRGAFIAYVPTQWSQLYPFPANFYDDYTHVRAFSRVGVQRLLEDAGFDRMTIEGYTPPLRAWQRPVGAALSRCFPFLWRAVANYGGPDA
jgi:SAM-dependent methyltransferase